MPKNNVETKLQIREKPMMAARLNKPVILGITIVVLILIGITIIQAFKTTSSKTNHPEMITADVDRSVLPTNQSSIKDLPSDYQQTDLIKKYLHQDTPPPSISPIVQQELDALRQQQTTLQEQLSQLSQKPQAQEPQSQNDEELQQAKTSGLFFPGVAPSTGAFYQKTKPVDSTSDGSSNTSPSSSDASNYAKQNMQLQKIDFLKPSKDTEDIYDDHSLVKPVSPYEIQAGTVIPASLVTAIDSSLPGDVVAQIQNDIFDSVRGSYLLVPKGSKLLGKYDSQIAYGQERVLIVFYRVIRPDGSSILLSKSTGADLFGQSGMQGTVDNHWGRVLGAATLSTILSMGAGVASDNNGSNNSPYYRSTEQNALLGAAGNIAQTGQTLTNRAIDIQPTLKIASGYQFNVIVNKDMILEPYSQE